MVVKNGRYGPYVTDGETNASLREREGDTVEGLTDERAAELLQTRRDAGPAKKRGGAKKAATKKAPAKKAGAKKTAAKKARGARRPARQEGPGQEGGGLGRRQEGSRQEVGDRPGGRAAAAADTGDDAPF